MENDRRIEEEEKRQDRLWRLQEEAVASGKANAAVEMRWNDLMEYNMPQDLNREITSQKDACARIIASKDRLIKEFQAELKAKDEEYVKALKRQEQDIVNLIARMTQQFKTLQRSYQVELDNIEDEFLKERAELLSSNKGEIDGLFDKRRKMEIRFMEEKQEREERYQREIEEMQAKDAEDYNKLKIKLENDIQTLEQQLEAMRATYLLNTEKLEYNYQVLQERDFENSATLQQQKRKLARLKDALSGLMKKYSTSDKAFKQRNAELTEEYRRITKQYRDLQHKFRHFEAADNAKFQEVWAMHESEMTDMVKKLMKADKIVHEQLLGMEWHPPEKAVAAGLVPDGAGAEGDGGDETAGDGDGEAAAAKGESGESGEAGGGDAGFDDFDDAGSGGGDAGDGEGGDDGGIAAAVEARKREERNRRVKVMLELLVDEAGFLVDEKVAKASAELSPEDAAVMQADAILRALAIESEDDIGVLLSYFFDEDAESVDGEDEDGADADPAKGLRLKVARPDVVRVVKQFVEDREAKRRDALEGADDDADGGGGGRKTEEGGAGAAGGAGGAASGGAGGRGGAGGGDDDAASVESERARTRRAEREFWHKLVDVVPSKTIRVWSALETALQQYNKILSDRSDLADEVDGLRAQNAELKAVLNQYLGSEVNEELHVPPTQVIRIDTGGAGAM